MFDELLYRLTAIDGVSHSAHYHFQEYGQHLLADRIAEIAEKKDDVQEVCYLGLGYPALDAKLIAEESAKYIPMASEDDSVNFANLKVLIRDTLILIESYDKQTRGVENLLGDIAQTLTQSLGLLHQIVEDDFDVMYNMSSDDKFDKVMKEFEEGTLKDPQGNVITDKDRALAIAYSESGKSRNESEWDKLVPPTV